MYIFLRKEVGEALESATNAVAAVQNMSDRIKTILNGPAPDDDAELCRLFTFVYNNNFLSQLKNSNLDVLGRAWILFRKQSFADRPQGSLEALRAWTSPGLLDLPKIWTFSENPPQFLCQGLF